MDSFFDSCIVINYLDYFIRENELKKKCFDYISDKNGNFFLCFYCVDEINTYIEKREIQYLEVLEKIKNKEYVIGSSKIAKDKLKKEEVSFAYGIYESVKNEEYNLLKNNLEKEIDILKVNFQIFLKEKINTTAIKKNEIDYNIVSMIYNFIEDYSDCKVLASAIQMQKNREIFYFVTADNHFIPGSYDTLKEDKRLSEYKIPRLINLLYN